MEQSKKRLLIRTLLLGGFFLVVLLLAVLFRESLVSLVTDPDRFKALAEEAGGGGKLLFVTLMAAQVVLAVIPGHPFEIVGGYCFGIWDGLLLTTLGAAVGSAIAFGLSRLLGAKAVSAFYSEKKIKKAAFLEKERNRDLLTFIAFLIPGLPKDMLAYFMGLTRMKFGKFLLFSMLGRLPGILIAVLGGAAVQEQSLTIVWVLLAVTAVVLPISLLLYRMRKAKT
jgi:uncharacterized membrane protein YdjX (TVP38/TMEM64 family)